MKSGLIQFARRGVQAAMTLSMEKSSREFEAAAEDPQRASQTSLERVIGSNRESVFGRAHGFQRIRTVADYREHTPIRTYEDFSPWIERAAKGEKCVLTEEPVLMFERTSGSSSARKIIPYTASLRADFQRATSAWIGGMYRSFPKLYGRSLYVSISASSRLKETTTGGIPIGFEDDTQYFGPLERLGWKLMLAVPTRLSQERDMEAWKFSTCLHLLREESLGFFSVWSPTFLTNLMESLEALRPRLWASLGRSARAKFDASFNEDGIFQGSRYWTHLQLLSCWTHGPSKHFLPDLLSRFPGIPLQPKGLLATEGVVSIPVRLSESNDVRGIADPLAFGTVVCPNAHFLEFLDAANLDAPALLAHELSMDHCYVPVLSTGGGLYRYLLKDVLRCTGFYKGLPLVEFEGKLDRVSDLVGEKLNGVEVEKALGDVFAPLEVSPKFALLAPFCAGGGKPRYRIYLDEAQADSPALSACAGSLDARLRTNYHYDYARAVGQLGEVEVVFVPNALAGYQAFLVSLGMKAGDIKPTRFDHRLNWHEAWSS